jgi:DNA-binding NarL/FixJ family response regulator
VSPRVLIVDDNEAFLEAASVLLERESVNVVGVARTTDRALALAGQLLPDVILVDVNLGAESGLELAGRLAEQVSGSPVILISTHAEADLDDLIATSAAIGFLPKSDLSSDSIRLILDSRWG